MKRWRQHLVVVAVLVLAAGAGAREAVGADPSPAPELTAVDVGGLAVSLESFKARKHVVLVFYHGHR